MMATREAFDIRLRKLRRGPAGGRFAVEQRLASELLPFARRHLELGEIYETRTSELAPFVANVVGVAQAHPDILPLLDELEVAVEEAIREIERNAEELARPDRELSSIAARRKAHLSQGWADLADLYERAEAVIGVGNHLVLGWRSDLADLRNLPSNDRAD
jgi:hypothetical protein